MFFIKSLILFKLNFHLQFKQYSNTYISGLNEFTIVYPIGFRGNLGIKSRESSHPMSWLHKQLVFHHGYRSVIWCLMVKIKYIFRLMNNLWLLRFRRNRFGDLIRYGGLIRFGIKFRFFRIIWHSRVLDWLIMFY